jgi:hypothetical protein
MKIEITYEQAVQRHPEAVQQALAMLATSRSKFKNSPPESFQWSYSLCVRIDGPTNIYDLFKQASQPRKELTEDEAVQDVVSRTHCVLQCRQGNGGHYCSKPIPPPQEYIDQQRNGIQTSRAERARYAALPPAFQSRETEELLRQLRRSPGFMEVRL